MKRLLAAVVAMVPGTLFLKRLHTKGRSADAGIPPGLRRLDAVTDEELQQFTAQARCAIEGKKWGVFDVLGGINSENPVIAINTARFANSEGDAFDKFCNHLEEYNDFILWLNVMPEDGIKTCEFLMAGMASKNRVVACFAAIMLIHNNNSEIFLSVNYDLDENQSLSPSYNRFRTIGLINFGESPEEQKVLDAIYAFYKSESLNLGLTPQRMISTFEDASDAILTCKHAPAVLRLIGELRFEEWFVKKPFKGLDRVPSPYAHLWDSNY